MFKHTLNDTSVLPSAMDRSVIDTWKAKERDFSDILYQKLQILTVIHPPSKEFQKNFTEDMFMKPNQKAFLHVMHYLFVLLDPNEFKKRFYWPVADKKAETFFRSSTVQYLNHLNEKHNLKWTQLTNYLVVMPGGGRFISFLIDFTDFVVDELTKRAEKVVLEQFPGEIGKNKQFSCEKLKKKSECFQSHCCRYIEEIDKATDAINNNTMRLKTKLEEICASQEINIEQLMEPEFLKEWNKYNWSLYQSKFESKWDELTEINNSLNKLRNKIVILLNNKSEISYDKDALLRSYKLIQADGDNHELFPKNELNIEALIEAFCNIIPIIDTALYEMQLKSTDRLEFESKEIEKLSYELTQLKTDMEQFGDNLRHEKSMDRKKTPNRSKFLFENDLRTKFINTPPISFDLEQSRVKIPRLPLLDDYVSQADSFTFADQTTLLLNRYSKSDPLRSAGKNKTKIVDPFTILKTVKKSKHHHKEKIGNLSILASEWKARELMLETEKENQRSLSVVSSVNKLSTPLKDPMNPTTPCSNKYKLRVQESASANKVTETRTPLSLDNAINQKRNLSNSLIYEPFDAFDFIKASTSPSGRLESLVKVESKDIPKTFLSEKALFEEKVSDIVVSSLISENVTVSLEDESCSMNLSIEFDKKIHLVENKDFIFDVSDSVLRDVSM